MKKTIRTEDRGGHIAIYSEPQVPPNEIRQVVNKGCADMGEGPTHFWDAPFHCIFCGDLAGK